MTSHGTAIASGGQGGHLPTPAPLEFSVHTCKMGPGNDISDATRKKVKTEYGFRPFLAAMKI